ncbi:hypothetical protein T439DRAFT_243486 [Meredithblackwellia eburnea MCA 4105]
MPRELFRVWMRTRGRKICPGRSELTGQRGGRRMKVSLSDCFRTVTLTVFTPLVKWSWYRIDRQFLENWMDGIVRLPLAPSLTKGLPPNRPDDRGRSRSRSPLGRRRSRSPPPRARPRSPPPMSPLGRRRSRSRSRSPPPRARPRSPPPKSPPRRRRSRSPPPKSHLTPPPLTSQKPTDSFRRPHSPSSPSIPSASSISLAPQVEGFVPEQLLASLSHLFVSNMPGNVTTAQMRRFFSGLDGIVGIGRGHYNDRYKNCSGFLAFKTKESRAAATTILTGKTFPGAPQALYWENSEEGSKFKGQWPWNDMSSEFRLEHASIPHEGIEPTRAWGRKLATHEDKPTPSISRDTTDDEGYAPEKPGGVSLFNLRSVAPDALVEDQEQIPLGPPQAVRNLLADLLPLSQSPAMDSISSPFVSAAAPINVTNSPVLHSSSTMNSSALPPNVPSGPRNPYANGVRSPNIRSPSLGGVTSLPPRPIQSGAGSAAGYAGRNSNQYEVDDPSDFNQVRDWGVWPPPGIVLDQTSASPGIPGAMGLGFGNMAGVPTGPRANRGK